MRIILVAAMVASLPVPAAAREVFAGVTTSDIDVSIDVDEGGTDLQLGYRTAPVAALRLIGRPSVQIFGSVNVAADTSFVAAGLSWKLTRGPVFVRPGLGMAVHDGPSRRVRAGGTRTDLGSRILFTPEIGLGLFLSPRWSIEASWTRLSHAQIFGDHNPGIDKIGLRLTRALR